MASRTLSTSKTTMKDAVNREATKRRAGLGKSARAGDGVARRMIGCQDKGVTGGSRAALSLTAVGILAGALITISNETGKHLNPRRSTESANASPSSFPVLREEFPGKDAPGWGSQWLLGADPKLGTGGGASRVAGWGRLTTSDLGDHKGEARISRRAQIPDRADVDLSFSFRFDATESYPAVFVRAESELLSRIGYGLLFERDSYYLLARENYHDVAHLALRPFRFADNTAYSARFAVSGTHLRVKVWLSSTPEPMRWSIDAIDGTISTPGAVGFSLGTGEEKAPSNWYVDDILIR
jgi:hypothetical protein